MSPTDVTATYRLQLHAGFTLERARQVVPYLAGLGVSHVYLSPVLASVPGSQHGYDVLDHGSIDPELGGREALEALAADCHEAGLGVIVDVVPNHMALTAPEWANAQVWALLLGGRQSATAHWFDIDWDALDGRVGLPILGAPLDQVLADGQLSLDTGRPDEGLAAGRRVIRYYEQVLPVADGTVTQPGEGDGGRDVADVLARQHYLLAHWQEAEAALNYRRFFEVDSLIAVRVEEPDVFEDTHRLLLDLHHGGVIDGFRIDHPDGLADPEDYLRRLTRQCRPGTPIWVEKILEGPERLPRGWECAGTTGYDGQAVLAQALVPEATTDVLDATWAATGGEPELSAVVDAAKRGAVDTLLTPEMARLARRAQEALPGEDPLALPAALRELLVAVDVYRAYVRPGQATLEADETRLRDAIGRAGEAGLAISFVTHGDWNLMSSIERYLKLRFERRHLPGLKAS